MQKNENIKIDFYESDFSKPTRFSPLVYDLINFFLIIISQIATSTR